MPLNLWISPQVYCNLMQTEKEIDKAISITGVFLNLSGMVSSRGLQLNQEVQANCQRPVTVQQG